MASSSAPVSVFDEHRFRKEFNQELLNLHARKRKVILEVGFNLNEDEYPQIMEQVSLRGWRRWAAPRTNVSKLMVQEFYANAAISDEEAAEQDEFPYKSFVRGMTDAPRPLSRPVQNSLIFKTDNIVVEESKLIERLTTGFVNKHKAHSIKWSNGGTNPVPNVLCVHNNVEPRSQQNSSKSRVTGKNSPW
ncbi:hypothetical protein PIB30_065232 [Stylosanthes scabra]|uniref:Uncharacterized protein n=1 Tax=Stylosanthes scabra TaxID=79078 RepID=A0ABU6WMN7_9FABA|nr:hypothetical protein [Stylosanthes scabra]